MIGDVQTPELVDGIPLEQAPVQDGGHEPTPWRIAGASILATLGVLPIRSLETSSEPLPSLAGNVLGAAGGGAVVGYIAAGDGRGAMTGALLTGGLSGLLGASMLLRRQEHRTTGIVVGGLSLATLLGCWFLSSHRE